MIPRCYFDKMVLDLLYFSSLAYNYAQYHQIYIVSWSIVITLQKLYKTLRGNKLYEIPSKESFFTMS